MIITPETKILALIRANASVIDAIASINPHFKKLQNPVLRKLLASRVTIREAARIGKCRLEDFITVLQPLGFTLKPEAVPAPVSGPTEERPDIKAHSVLDVRGDIADGKDPFLKIMTEVGKLGEGETLLLINGFEPAPLIRILKERGFTAVVGNRGVDLVYTYLTKTTRQTVDSKQPDAGDFSAVKRRFEGNLRTIDVRDLPMPKPMLTILETLETLETGTALYVHHKKLPLFLIPELEQRNYKFVYETKGEGVDLIIYPGDV